MSLLLPGVVSYEPDPRNFTAHYLKSSRKCGNGAVIISGSGPKSACPVALYIDGVMLVDSSVRTDPSTLPNLSALQTKQFAGVEYYADGATLPPKFSATSSGCGTLLLWTRER